MNNQYAASDWTRRQIAKQEAIEAVARAMYLSGASKVEVIEQCDKLHKLSMYGVLKFKENLLMDGEK